MVHQNDPKQPLCRQRLEAAGQGVELLLAETPGRAEDRRRACARQAHDRHLAPSPDERETELGLGRQRLAGLGHVGGPLIEGLLWRDGHIGVVIARHHRHPVRRPQSLQPVGRLGELVRQSEIDQVAGHRDVVGRGCLDIRNQGRQNRRIVDLGSFVSAGEIA